jgi:hypothetical protein
LFPDEGALDWLDELSSVEVPLPELLEDPELAELDPPQTAGPGMV